MAEKKNSKKPAPAPAQATDSKADKPKPIKVRAMALGVYSNKRRRPGDEFLIKSEKEFSEKWMERVGSPAAKPIETAAELEDEGDESGEGDESDAEGSESVI